MKVYADLYFLINFEVDFLLLCLVGRLLYMKKTPLRCILAACVGGVLSCITLLAESRILSVAVLLFGAPLMLLAAFGKAPFCSVKETARCLALFFGASFLTGGIIEFLVTYAAPTVSPKLLFLSSAVVLYLAFCLLDSFSLSESLKTVTVTFRDFEIERKSEIQKVSQDETSASNETERMTSLRLLCDSGCLVREPISGMPVILLSARRFDRLFPSEELYKAENASRYRLRYVPIQTASGHGVIPAVCPCELLCSVGDRNPRACRALLGRAETDSFAGFDGVFPAALLPCVE